MTPQTKIQTFGLQARRKLSGACILGFLGAKVDPTEGRVGLSGATEHTRPSLHSASERNGRCFPLPPVSAACPRGIPKCNHAWTRKALTISAEIETHIQASWLSCPSSWETALA